MTEQDPEDDAADGDPSAAGGLLWTFEFEGAPGHVSLERVTFSEVDGRTTVHTHSVYQSVEARDAMVAAGEPVLRPSQRKSTTRRV